MSDNYVRIFDTTLRDGEQSPGATLTSSEKLEIARMLARMGVDVMEAGFPAASPDDLEAVRQIALEVGCTPPAPGRSREDHTTRVVDLIAPLGKGQRTLIVAPARAGKTMLLQAIIHGVATNYPEALLLVLLVDERPEEVTEMQMIGHGEVIASSFDFPAERHVAIAEMTLEIARRQVESGRDVVLAFVESYGVAAVDDPRILRDAELTVDLFDRFYLDTEKGGYDTAKLLDALIRGSKLPYDVVVKPTQIITRQSTDIYATNDSHIATTLKYIHQNIEKSLHVDEIVKQVPLSRRSLEKRFLNTTGLPVYKYIFNLRMEKFTQQLLDTDQTVFEIALDLGFNDGKNIARQFKQVKGCNPIEYRRRNRIGKQEA